MLSVTCSKTGHIKVICRFGKPSVQPNNLVKNKNIKDFKVKSVNEYYLKFLQDKNRDINGKQISFEVESGAAHSIVCKSSFDTLFLGKWYLKHSKIKLHTDTSEDLNLLDELNINDIVDTCIPNLKLLIIKEEGPILIGETLLKASKLFWSNTNMINGISKHGWIDKFPKVFGDMIGSFKSPPISVKLKKDAKSIFLKVCALCFKKLG